MVFHELCFEEHAFYDRVVFEDKGVIMFTLKKAALVLASTLSGVSGCATAPNLCPFTIGPRLSLATPTRWSLDDRVTALLNTAKLHSQDGVSGIAASDTYVLEAMRAVTDPWVEPLRNPEVVNRAHIAFYEYVKRLRHLRELKFCSPETGYVETLYASFLRVSPVFKESR